MKVQLKYQFSQLHRQTGALFGLFLFIILFTGSWSLGHESLNLWGTYSSFNTDLLSIDELLKKGEIRLGEYGFNRVILPSIEYPIITFCQEMAECVLQLNAQTGEPIIINDAIFPIVSLHKNLFIGFPGRLFISLFGFIFSLLLITGIFIHHRKIKLLFRLRLNRGRKLFFFDIHNLIGLWSYPWLVIFALTGALSGVGAFGTVMLAKYVEPKAPTQVMVKLMGQSVPITSELTAFSPEKLLTQLSQKKPEFIPENMSWKNKGKSDQQLIIGGVNLFLPSTANFEQFIFSGLDSHWLSEKSSSYQQFWTRAFIAVQPVHYGQYQWTGTARISLIVFHFMMGLAACLLTYSGLVIWCLRNPFTFSSRLVIGSCTSLIFSSVLLLPMAIFSALPPILSFFSIWGVTLLFYFFYQHIIRLTVFILVASGSVLLISALSHLAITGATLWWVSCALLISAVFCFLISLFLLKK